MQKKLHKAVEIGYDWYFNVRHYLWAQGMLFLSKSWRKNNLSTPYKLKMGYCSFVILLKV